MANIDQVKKINCTGCAGCTDVCAFGAITFKKDPLGFEYPSIDKHKCTGCGKCAIICPSLGKICNGDGLRYFGAKALSDDIRFNSSSGGLFPLLAGTVLKRGGTVIGACLDNDMTITHIAVKAINDLHKLTKTKYVQSNAKGIYSFALDELRNGREVLFVGTPCQTDAMHRIAGSLRKRLLLIDLICYGVMSPGIWSDYIKYLGKRYSGKVECFDFRDKRNADDGHTVSFSVGGKEYTSSIYADKLLKTYFKNVNIRESCLNCKFNRPHRNSDITIGDFWGIDKVKPGFSDKMGTSLVIVHNKKGEEAISEIKESMNIFECDFENARQPRLESPTKGHRRRNIYMALYKVLPFKIWLRVTGR